MELSKSFLGIAVQATVVRRAILYAVFVGPVLIAINHGDTLVAGDVSTTRVCKMALTLLVPYVVSTLSSVGATRESSRPQKDPSCFHPPTAPSRENT